VCSPLPSVTVVPPSSKVGPAAAPAAVFSQSRREIAIGYVTILAQRRCYPEPMRLVVFSLSLVLVSCSSTPDTSSATTATDGKAYCQKAAKEPGATLTPSGMVYQELKPGTGPSPKPTDMVKVHYRGTLIDGTEFDSSI